VADRGFAAGVRLAVTTLTVAPLRPARVDRASAGVAMSVAPAVGAGLGVLVATVGIAATRVGAPAGVAGVLVIGAGVALTRGLHLDGLADTADALGSYRDPEAALAIMRKPDVGPFGVVALVLVLLAQVAAVATVLGRGWPHAAAAIVAATAAGRAAIALACRRGVPAARPDGLGALVSGTVSLPAGLAGAAGVLIVAVWAVPARAWQGPVAVTTGIAVALLLVAHAVRRLRGITGDVLGAACETAVAISYVLMSIS
jgi:adenosylcobinamide-GDP ribazoletransferase